MSRWFRHYAGMMRDDKLVSVAIKSKQPVERVVWVWGAILESAAEIDDDGRFSLDAAEVAYFLRTDEADIGVILDALVRLGRVSADRVVKWGDRQFTSDRSADRQARYRERKRSQTHHSDEGSSSPDGIVTSPSRDGDAPETDTELEADTEKTRPPVPVAEARALFDELWAAFPQNPTSPETKAEAAFSATKAKDRDAILAAARRYRQWFTEDNLARKRTETAGLRFAPHLATWLTDEGWRDAAALPVKADASAPVVPMVKVDRVLDAELFAACEAARGKPTPISPWSFSADVVARARQSISEQSNSGAVH